MIYIARDKDGYWWASFKQMCPQKSDSTWRHGLWVDHHDWFQYLFPFINPGEQWKQERIRSTFWNRPYLGESETSCMMKQSTDECFYEARRVAPGYEVFRWMRIATLDDKPEEFWASMDANGRTEARRAKPEWAGLCFLTGYRSLPNPSGIWEIVCLGLQPGMLCKVRKVGEHNYQIISVEECHLPIEVEWQQPVGFYCRANLRVEHCHWKAPYLPGTNIQIICPFEEKKKKCQRNYCPQCSCPVLPDDKFCRYCGTRLKGDC